MPNALDIEANRHSAKYTPREMAWRVAWGVGKLLFRACPRPCFGWRRFVLRSFGAEIGTAVNIYRTAEVFYPWNLTIGDWTAIDDRVFIYNLGPVRLGKSVTISWGARLCAGTHDYTKSDMPLLKPPITIGDNVWICAEAFVGPGIRIGDGAVVGARAVVLDDVEPWMIVAGNPARVVRERRMKDA